MLNIRYLIQILILYLILLKLVLSLAFNNTKQKEIEALEKEKNELMKQIHVAIDDSVSLLKDENSTHSMQGANYMLELKQQMENIQNADLENGTMEEDSRSELENRRKMKSRLKFHLRSTTKKARKTTLDRVFDVESVLFGKKMSKDKLKQLIANREAMKKRLDEWILQRELEKAKIKDRLLANKKLLQSGLLEKCPRFGYGKKKKKKDYRRRSKKRDLSDESENEDPSKEKTKAPKKARKGSKYPCCRKCCKKSYLGCL